MQFLRSVTMLLLTLTIFIPSRAIGQISPPGGDDYGAEILGLYSTATGDTEIYASFPDSNFNARLALFDPESDGIKQEILTGDYNGDGLDDVALVSTTGGGVLTAQITLGGSYSSSPQWTQLGQSGIALHSAFRSGDFDGDGFADIASIYFDTPATADTLKAKISFGPNGTRKSTWTIGQGLAREFLVGDFNNGQADDIATVRVERSGDRYYLRARIYAGETAGGLYATWTITDWSVASSLLPGDLLSGDFNGDGIDDLALTSVGSGGGDGTYQARLLLGPSATVATRTVSTGVTAKPFKFVSGDFNRDYVTDIAAIFIDGGHHKARIAFFRPAADPADFRTWTLSHGQNHIFSAFVTADLNQLSAPQDVVASDGTRTDSVRVSWASEPIGTASYLIYRSTSATPCSGISLAGPRQLHYDDTGAVPGVIYNYSVRSVGSSGGLGACSTVDPGYRALTAPTGVSATDGTSVSGTLVSWNATSGAVSYDVFRSLTSTACAGSPIISGVSGTSWNDLTGTPGVTYYYSLRARGESGSYSACSAVDPGYRRVGAPTSLTASDGTSASQVTIGWQSVAGAVTYRLFRSATAVACDGSPLATDLVSTSFADTNITPGVTAYYSVLAIGANGAASSCSNVDAGYRSVSAPGSISASDGTSAGQIDVVWSTVSGAVNYDLYRSTSDTRCIGSPLAQSLASTSHADSGATPGVNYFYSVVARGANGSISQCSATDVGFRRVAASSSVQASDGLYPDRVVITWNVPLGATAFDLYRSDSAQSCSGAPRVSGLAAPTYDDTEVTPGVTYYYSVRARGVNGQAGDCSAFDGGYRVLVSPTTIVASDGSDFDKVIVSWSSVPSAVSYELFRSEFSLACNGTPLVAGFSETSRDDTTAVPGVNYFYSVRARGENGAPGLCSGVDVGYRAVTSPTNLQASDGTSASRVLISWGASPGAVNYDLYRSLNSEACVGAPLATALPSVGFEDLTATPGITYYYSAIARGANGVTSACSAVDSGYRAVDGPLGVVASDGAYTERVAVTWASIPDAVSYDVYRAESPVACSGSLLIDHTPQTAFDDTTADPGITYYYSVRPFGINNEPGICSGVDAGFRALLAPGSVSASDGEFTEQVRVTWQVRDGAVNYELYRATSDTACQGSPLVPLVVGASYDDLTAVPGINYYYSLRGRGGNGSFSTCSNVDVGYRALAAPAAISASDGTDSDKVRVNWSAVSGSTSYRLFRSASALACDATPLAVDLLTTSFDDTTATPGVDYHYSVRAVGQNGSVGACSNIDVGYRSLVAPSLISASDGTSTAEVSVAWSAVPGAAVYDLYRNTTGLRCSGDLLGDDLGSVSFGDTSASPGVTYSYSVRAQGANGQPGVCSVVDTGYRAANGGTSVAASDGTSLSEVSVTWSAVDGAQSYLVYRSSALGACVDPPIASDITELSFSDTQAVPGFTYGYSIKPRALNGTFGTCSNVDTGYRAIAAPATISASDGTDLSRVSVLWSTVSGAISFDLYRSTVAEACVGTPLAVDLATASFNDNSANPGQVYYYSVLAKGENRIAGPCSVVDSGFRGLVAPQNLIASDGTNPEGVDVSWQAVLGATSYRLFRSPTSGGTGLEIATVAGTTFLDRGTEPCDIAYYYVLAIVSGFESNPSNRDSGYRGSVGSCDGVPAAPVNLTATDGTSSELIEVRWGASPRAIDYTLYRSQFEGSIGDVLQDGLTQPAFDDRTAVPGVFYYYTAVARNDRGVSALSNTDRGYRAAIEGCSADCDGDGVCDAQEIIDGTAVCDPGSFITHLESPVFTKYNTFLTQQNYLELIATGPTPVRAVVTVYNIDGSVAASAERVVNPQSQIDVDINQFAGRSNTYGVVRIDFNDNEAGATLIGRLSTYRLNRSGGGYSFAFARELRNASRGVSFATGNSFDPMNSGFLVPNWAEIINVNDTPLELRYNLYNQEGELRDSRLFTVAPRGEIDVQAGHEFGEGVYISEFIPLDGAKRYLASVVRYSSNSTGGGEADTYNFAFALESKAGNGTRQFMPITNRASAAWQQLNWVEVLNVRERATSVELVFRDNGGLEVQRSVFSLAPRNQYHLPAFSFLPKGQTGSVEISASEPGSIVAQSAVYFLDTGDNLLQTAYVSPGRIGGQSLQAGSFNTNLGMTNELTLIATSSAETAVQIQSRQGMTLLSDITRVLNGSSTVQANLDAQIFGIPSDAYGSLLLRTDQGGVLVAENLRLRAEPSGKMDFVMPTTLQ